MTRRPTTYDNETRGVMRAVRRLDIKLGVKSRRQPKGLRAKSGQWFRRWPHPVAWGIAEVDAMIAVQRAERERQSVERSTHYVIDENGDAWRRDIEVHHGVGIRLSDETTNDKSDTATIEQIARFRCGDSEVATIYIDAASTNDRSDKP